WDSKQIKQQQIATATSIAATAPAATAEAIAAASVIPTFTPTIASNDVRHLVQPGETLGTIAQRYNVSWEDIYNYNQLTDANNIPSGIELIIPIGGIPTPTLSPTPLPTSSEPPTPIPTEPPAAGEAKVLIREVVGVGNLNEEAVVIANEGSRQVQLANWKLEDSQGNVYTFNPFILFGNGANLVLHTRVGTDTTFDLYWGLGFPVWEPGEIVTLRDADGTARDTLTVP
ncbi:MAG: lamin tail domain-containing protein, partial [Anaerolineales bacterium]|nr:lamin tail domain-containing protein [Anaerolineales bacterium]